MPLTPRRPTSAGSQPLYVPLSPRARRPLSATPARVERPMSAVEVIFPGASGIHNPGTASEREIAAMNASQSSTHLVRLDANGAEATMSSATLPSVPGATQTYRAIPRVGYGRRPPSREGAVQYPAAPRAILNQDSIPMNESLYATQPRSISRVSSAPMTPRSPRTGTPSAGTSTPGMFTAPILPNARNVLTTNVDQRVVVDNDGVDVSVYVQSKQRWGAGFYVRQYTPVLDQTQIRRPPSSATQRSSRSGRKTPRVRFHTSDGLEIASVEFRDGYSYDDGSRSPRRSARSDGENSYSSWRLDGTSAISTPRGSLQSTPRGTMPMRTSKSDDAGIDMPPRTPRQAQTNADTAPLNWMLDENEQRETSSFIPRLLSAEERANFFQHPLTGTVRRSDIKPIKERTASKAKPPVIPQRRADAIGEVDQNVVDELMRSLTNSNSAIRVRAYNKIIELSASEDFRDGFRASGGVDNLLGLLRRIEIIERNPRLPSSIAAKLPRGGDLRTRAVELRPILDCLQELGRGDELMKQAFREVEGVQLLAQLLNSAGSALSCVLAFIAEYFEHYLPLQATFRHIGGVPVLHAILSTSHKPEVQLLAMAAIRSLCEGCGENLMEFINCGLLHCLLHIVANATVTPRLNAALTLGVLCMEAPEVRDFIYDAGGVPSLVKLVSLYRSAAAVSALAEVCDGHHGNQDVAAEHSALSLLIQLLKAENHSDAVRAIMIAICTLCHGNDRNRETFGYLGGLSVLTTLFDQDPFVLHSAMTLACVVNQHAFNQSRLASFINTAHGILVNNPGNHKVLCTATVLRAICAGNGETQKRARNCLSQLLRMLNDKLSDDLRNGIIKAAFDICDGNDANCEMLAEQASGAELRSVLSALPAGSTEARYTMGLLRIIDDVHAQNGDVEEDDAAPEEDAEVAETTAHPEANLEPAPPPRASNPEPAARSERPSSARPPPVKLNSASTDVTGKVDFAMKKYERAQRGPAVTIRASVVGPPGAGKTTQAKHLARKYNLVLVQPHQLLMDEATAGTALGQEALAHHDDEKMPDEIVLAVIKKRLEKDDCKVRGFVIDGFPDTPFMAEHLSEHGIDLNRYIVIDVADDIATRRLLGRRVDPVTSILYHDEFYPAPATLMPRLTHYEEDTPDRIKLRLEHYHASAGDTHDFHGDVFYHVAGEEGIEDVAKLVVQGITTDRLPRIVPTTPVAAIDPALEQKRKQHMQSMLASMEADISRSKGADETPVESQSIVLPKVGHVEDEDGDRHTPNPGSSAGSPARSPSSGSPLVSPRNA